MNPSDTHISRRTFAASSTAALALGLTAGRRGRSPEPLGPANVQVTNDGFTAHLEPVVAVNPRDPAILLASCRVVQDSTIRLASYTSADCGRSWRCNGLLPGLGQESGGNMTAAFSQHGHGLPVRHPRNSGVTWPPQPGRCGALAHQRPRPAARLPGHGDPRRGQWPDVRAAQAHDPVTGTQANLPVITAGPGGTVHVAYFVVSATAGILTTVSSADYGETFAAPVSQGAITATGPDMSGITIKSGPTIAAAPGSDAVYAAMTSSGRPRGVLCPADGQLSAFQPGTRG
jgi:hypothetical protein